MSSPLGHIPPTPGNCLKWSYLPGDVLVIVLQFVDRDALRALRLVNRRYGEFAAKVLFAEIHLSASLISCQRMADIANSLQYRSCPKKLVYHCEKPSGGLTDIYEFQRALSQLRQKMYLAPQQFPLGPRHTRSAGDCDFLEGISALRSKIEVTVPPHLLGILAWNEADVWELHDKYLEEVEARTSFAKVANEPEFLHRLNQTLAALPNLRSLDFSFSIEGSQVVDAASSMWPLIKSRAGDLPISIKHLELEWDKFSRFMTFRDFTSMTFLENLQSLQLHLKNSPRPSSPWAGGLVAERATQHFNSASSLRSLALCISKQTGSKPRKNTETFSDGMLAARWPHLERLRIHGLIFTEASFRHFIDAHSKTLTVLELGNITLKMERLILGQLSPSSQPSIFRLFSQIYQSCNLERVQLRGKFSDSNGDVWCSNPKEFSRRTPFKSALERVELSMCRRGSSGSEFPVEKQVQNLTTGTNTPKGRNKSMSLIEGLSGRSWHREHQEFSENRRRLALRLR